MEIEGEDDHPTWDNHETRDLVTSVFGKAQWNLAFPSVRSMLDRPEFARYHYHEARKLMEDFIQQRLAGGGLLRIYQDYDEFSGVMLRIRAHAVALIQSLHAIPDTCAHMLYYCIGLNRLPDAPTGRRIAEKSVLRMLEAEGRNGKPEYAMLCALFERLTQGDDYERLNALANTLKHRSIIRPSLNEDWTGTREDRHILQLEAFEYEGREFSPLDLRKFMQREHDRIQPLTVEIGYELNQVLRSGAVARPSIVF